MLLTKTTSHIRWIVLLLLSCADARADGLIYGLPPDGAWVQYKLTEEGQMEFKMPDESADPAALPVEVNGTLRLSSVGKAEWEGIPCRWIELKFDVEIRTKKPDALPARLPETSRRRIILKMLIPEAHLAAGSDPLANVQQLYYKDGDRAIELIEDEKDQQYQLDRFRPVFPELVANPTSTAGHEVETPHPTLGRLKCEKLTFDSTYEGPLDGRPTRLVELAGRTRGVAQQRRTIRRGRPAVVREVRRVGSSQGPRRAGDRRIHQIPRCFEDGTRSHLASCRNRDSTSCRRRTKKSLDEAAPSMRPSRSRPSEIEALPGLSYPRRFEAGPLPSSRPVSAAWKCRHNHAILEVNESSVLHRL
jgi:hypothetical protein